MPTALKVKKRYVYIPDTSFAEEWRGLDEYKVRGQWYRLLPNMERVKAPRNGRKKRGNYGTTDKR